MGLGEKLRNALEKLRTARVVDKEAVKEAVKEIQRALISADVEVQTVLELSKRIEKEAFEELPKGFTRREFVVKKTYDLLAELLGGQAAVPKDPKKILLVGLFGAGKSTTVAKIAKYYAKRGKKVRMVCADSFRPAAFEQLKQLSEKAGIAFFGLKGEKNAAKIVKACLKETGKEDLLVVDSAGRNALDKELEKEIKEINSELKPDQTWLVMGADLGQVAKKQAIAFHSAVGVNGVVLTRMDGSAKGGGALAACSATKSPVYFIGIGEKLEDLEEFDAQRYLGRIMGYGDLEGLLEKAKEALEEEEFSPEELLKGDFTLQTFYEQLKAARKMGPFGKIMEMIGLSSQVPKELVDIGEQKLEGFKVMIDSMAKKEKSNPELMNRSRILRVSKGSGKSEADVRELLKQYKRMKAVFKKFKDLGEADLQDLSGKKMQRLLQKMGKAKKKKIRIR